MPTGLKGVPVPTCVPFVAASHQVTVPPHAEVKEIVADPPGQTVLPVVVGGLAFVKITSSNEAVHGALEMVHLSVTLCPAAKPVTVEVGEESVVTMAPLAAPCILHAPVPFVGVLPASVKVPLLQFVWSGPAAAVVGGAATTTVALAEAVQPLGAVYVTVYTLFPAAGGVTGAGGFCTPEV